jgi:hypothetical protein
VRWVVSAMAIHHRLRFICFRWGKCPAWLRLPVGLRCGIMHFSNDRAQGVIITPLLLVVFVSSIISFAQTSPSQVPDGVKIKVASDADNTLAKAALEGALANDSSFPRELLGDTATCGPTLWAALKGSADETLLHSKVVTAMLSVPEPLQTVGRGISDRGAT